MWILAVELSSSAEPSPRLVRVEEILERTITSTPIPLSPEVKSFLIPGWGQLAQKRTVPALFFGGTEAAALAASIVYAIRGDRAYASYQAATTPEEAIHFREQTRRADRARNLSLLSGAVIWGLNLLDVVHAEKHRSKRLSVRLCMGCGPMDSREMATWEGI